jgi:excisionase family DNA binding protein
MAEETLTVPDVAAVLRVSEYTVRDYLRTGQLRGFRLGGTKAGWRIRPSALQAFIERQEEAAEAEAAARRPEPGR